ncbi:MULTISPECIES: hypothetical protein [Tabrizicola]|nr:MULTISPECIES: hypothetical protein [Paracoccaceae]
MVVHCDLPLPITLSPGRTWDKAGVAELMANHFPSGDVVYG